MTLSRIDRVLLFIMPVFVLSACAVGPDFKPPLPPSVTSYTRHPLPETINAGKEEPLQSLQMGKKVSREWWMIFHSRPINNMVNQAIANNQDLAAAMATLASSQESVRQALGGFYPQIDGNAGFQRSKTGSRQPPFNLYTVGGAISYMPDVFGGTRRTVEQQTALADFQCYQLGAAYLSITGNIVIESITLATLYAQLESVKAIVASDEQNLRLVQQKYQAGKAAKSDVITAQSQLANDRTQIAPILQQISITEDALSVLAGRPTGNWTPPRIALDKLKLPSNLPVSLPSQLVHQRPDILAAEATLHANSAAIGIAIAQMFPQITLTGDGNFQANTTSNLFTRSSFFWSLAANLTSPIFHGGSLMAQRAQAIDNFKASAASYQQTVLQAFSQVADTLQALKHDAEQLQAQKQALNTAKELLRLQRISYTAGKGDLLLLLFAQRSYQLSRLGYVQALGQRYKDTAQLYVALGGDWQAEGLPKG